MISRVHPSFFESQQNWISTNDTSDHFSSEERNNTNMIRRCYNPLYGRIHDLLSINGSCSCLSLLEIFAYNWIGVSIKELREFWKLFCKDSGMAISVFVCRCRCINNFLQLGYGKMCVFFSKNRGRLHWGFYSLSLNTTNTNEIYNYLRIVQKVSELIWIILQFKNCCIFFKESN